MTPTITLWERIKHIFGYHAIDTYQVYEGHGNIGFQDYCKICNKLFKKY